MIKREDGYLGWRLFENSFGIILLFNEKGEITGWNDKARQQLKFGDMDKVMITDVFRREFKKVKDRVIPIKTGDIETFAYRKNLTCFPVDLKIFVEEAEGRYIGVCNGVNSVNRITAIRNAEKAKEEVELAEQLRSDFVSNVTHELRTPLNGIMGIAGALKDTVLTDEQKSLLNIVDRCCRNMSNIIDDLLDFSKLEAGKFSLEEREFKFREFIDRTMEANLPMINEKGLLLSVSITPDIPEYVVGDELRLTQILNNLLSNGIKFTNVGQISVEVNKTSDFDNGEIELFFMVMDTGIGIDKKDLDKLFQSFSQVDASITRRYGGTGLGLCITKQLVELMNGNIFVESEKGKGSTFSFSIRLKCLENRSNKNLESGSFVYDGLSKKSVESLSSEEADQFYYGEYGRDSNDLRQVYEFGTPENLKEISRNMEKLILCIEMDNWEKAEEFAQTIKVLVGEERVELKRSVFRLELSIRKEAKEKSLMLYEALEKLLEECC